MRPAGRDEDRMARIISRAQDGVYSGQQADFASEAAAVEITLANGGQARAVLPMSTADAAAATTAPTVPTRYGVDWLASGPPRSTGEAALANFTASGLELANPGSYYGDPDDDDQPWQPVPQHTVELAHQLAADWGLGADAGGLGEATWFTRTRCGSPASPVSVADAVYEGMGYELPSQEQPSYPGIAQLTQI